MTMRSIEASDADRAARHGASSPRRAGFVVSAFAVAALWGLISSALAGGTVETGRAIASTTLGRTIAYSIYLPVRVGGGRRRLPVLYLLHGRGDDEKAWIEKGGIVEILDRNIAAGKLRPLIVVMPAAGNSWYVDDAQPGRYGAVAKAFTTDLIDSIEARYPIDRCRGARAVGGLSMGGYGAMLYALERPDLYSSAFSLSGSLFSEDPADIEKRRTAYERIYQGVFGAPFNAEKFLASNVFLKLDRTKRHQSDFAVWLAAGNRDFPSILEGTTRMNAELKRRSILSELHVLEGDHSWALWQTTVEPALIWLSGRLVATCAKP
jgi:S-formylglutathione hydrolase FrmB